VTDATSWSKKYLDYEFVASDLLEHALTHKSRSARNNERLEFLGDAVLDLVIAETLYRQERETDEGSLSRLRASLVRGETLAEIAADIQLSDVVRLSGGEARSGGHQRASIIADALEAVLGAVFLDQGYGAAERVIQRLYADRLAVLPAVQDLKDPKTNLQELLQSRGMDVPEYAMLNESGPPHARHFLLECRVPALAIAVSGVGSSRRSAEQVAASAALQEIEAVDHAAP
jgi:ribonuclease-3